MNKYRSHNCNELRKDDLNKDILISGWINKKRDHGNLLFIDLRDNYGITQCIIDKDNKPNWSPEKINDVKDDFVNEFFNSLDNNELIFN